MSELTAAAIELCRIGFSASEATAFVVQGRNISPAAINRIESVVAADLAKCRRESAKRRAA
jgi:hypothetical protein